MPGVVAPDEGDTTVAPTDTTGEGGEPTPGAAGVDRRQVALVALCLLGLVVAAFVAPVSPDAGGFDDGAGSGPDGGDGGDSGGDDGGGDDGVPQDGEPRGGDGDGDSGDGGDVITDDGAPVPVPGGDAPPTNGCAIVLEERPVPGAVVPVTVYVDREPASDVRVWFGDRAVGRTDEAGRVAGRVPYSRRLNVTARVPGEDCEFYRRPYEDERDGSGDVQAALTGESAGLTAVPLTRSTLSPIGESPAHEVSRQATPDDRNDTASYAVDGVVNLTVLGEPYPGETVTLLAAVDEVPMRYGAVSVDGERVGRTTADGTYELSVPRETEQFTVTVERGDFAGSAAVDVLLLDASVRPQEGLPFPGEPALVTATVGDEPTPDARASLDEARLGETDGNGTVGLTLPAALDGTVTVETERQTDAVPMRAVYLPTILPSALLLVGGVVGAVVTGRARGRGAATRVATWWVAVATLFVAVVVWEWLGLLAAGGVVLLGAAVRHQETVRSGGNAAAGGLSDLAAFVRSMALSVADWAAAALDRAGALLRRLAARIAALPLSVRGLARRFRGWLRSLPGWLRSAATARLSARGVGAFAVATALVAGATDRFGALGFLGSLVVLFVGYLAYRRRTREGPAPGESDDTDSGPALGEAPSKRSAEDGPKRRALRALWRRFARWVRPNSWRQSTPGEVSRAAIDRGFPERPVRVLTDAFRDVEYGDRSSSDRADEAREAFDSIEREREGEEP